MDIGIGQPVITCITVSSLPLLFIPVLVSDMNKILTASEMSVGSSSKSWLYLMQNFLLWPRASIRRMPNRASTYIVIETQPSIGTVAGLENKLKYCNDELRICVCVMCIYDIAVTVE